jgi:hypothetical protein
MRLTAFALELVFGLALVSSSALAERQLPPPDFVPVCDRGIANELKQTLKLDCHEIGPQDLARLTSLTIVAVADEPVRTLTARDLQGLVRLTDLMLSGVEVQPGAFQVLNSLNWVAWQFLGQLTAAHFAGLEHITSLSLGLSRQVLQPGVFAPLGRLQTLSLQGDFEFAVSPSAPVLGHLPWLKNVTLSAYHAKELPQLFAGNDRLESFEIDSLSSLESISQHALQGAPGLLNLDIKASGLGESELPSSLLADVPNLEHFSIWGSGLKWISPSFFENCRSLRTITMKDGKLEGIQVYGAFAKLSVLEKVDFSGNPIRYLEPGLFFHTGVTDLDFSGGNLTALPDQVFGPATQRLNLRNNRIAELPADPFAELQSGKLNRLDLVGNPLRNSDRIRLKQRFGDRIVL